MTISTANRKAGPFTGNGVTVAFPFAFKVFTTADVLVVQAVTSTGVETTLALGTNYTVTLNADQNANPGGTITALVAPPTGTTLTATSQVANLQNMDLTNAGGFYPKVLNDAADRAAIQIQQTDAKATRSLKFPVSDTVVGVTLPPAAQRVGKALVFDASGNVIVSADNYVNQLANVTAQAGISTTKAAEASASAAAALASLNDFKGRYYGALAADPAVDPLGNPCTSGDLYFNTTLAYNKTFTGAAWERVFYETAALAAIDADVAAVDASRITSQGLMSADVDAVESSKSSALLAIGTKVAAVGAVVDWTNTYLGGKAANPTTRNNASALQNGDMYFNTGTNRMMAYASGTWYATETMGATDAALVSYTDKAGTVFVVSNALKSLSYYVDGVGGLDSNSGSISAPLKTITAALAKPCQSDTTIYLKRGCVFREQLEFSGQPAGMLISAYGAGNKPIMSGQDLVSAFSVYGAGPAYTFTIDLPAGGANRVYAGIWEDNIRLTEILVGDVGVADAAAAIAKVAATPGSFYFAGPGGYSAGWSAGTKTYYVQASNSTNPATNGKVYEAYKREFVVNPYTFPGAVWRDVHIQSGFHHDGFGDDFNSVSISRIARHGNLPAVPMMKNVIVSDPNVKLDGAYFHSNPSAAVADCVYDSCTVAGSENSYVGIAFYSHGGTGQYGLRNRALIKDCEVYNVNTCISLGIVNNVEVVNLKARNFISFAGIEKVMNLWGCDVVGGTTGGGMGRHFTYGTTGQVNIYGCRFDLAAPSGGVFNGDTLGGFRMENSLFVVRCVPAPGNYTAFFISAGTGTCPSVVLKKSRIVAPADTGFTYLLAAKAITAVDIQDVLLVNGVTTCIINGVNTPLATLDPDAKIFTISATKCLLDSTPGNVSFKFGTYEPGDFVYSAVAHPGGATEPRAFAAVGDRIYYAGAPVAYIPAYHLNAVCFANTGNYAVAVGESGLIARSNSSSLYTWGTIASGTSTRLRGVASNGATVVAAGDGGLLLRSTDSGATWAAVTSNTTRDLYCVSVNGTTWLAAGAEGRVVRSTDDGVTWAEATVGTTLHYSLFRSEIGNLFLMGSDSGLLRTSSDGITWTTRTSNTYNRIVSFAVCYTKIYAALKQTGQYPDTLLSSTDGINWTVEPTTFPFEIRSIAGGGTSPYVGDMMAVGEASTLAYARTGEWTLQRMRMSESTTYGNEMQKWMKALAA